METVEVLIRIPKYEYEKCKRDEEQVRFYQKQGLDGESKYMVAILDGTILPKGHGKLIAEPTEEEIVETIGGKNDFAECIREAVKAVFDNAPTIIEAEKEVENG